MLLVSSFYPPEMPGGAEKTMSSLASSLVRRGYTICVMTTGEAELVENVEGVEVHRFKIDNFFRKIGRELPGPALRAAWQVRDIYSFKMANRLAMLIETFRPDVVQFHNVSGITRSVWSVPKKFGVPAVQVLHDLNTICPNSSMFKNGRSCRERCLSCTAFRAGSKTGSKDITAVVGVSEYVLKRVTQEGLFNGALQRVIYNRQQLPDPLPLPLRQTGLRFGYIGSLAPHKGLGWLIDQFDDSLGALVIAGTGQRSYIDELRALAQGKSIDFVGYVDPIKFFEDVDIAVVPSIWEEALGNVAVEASSLGRPVIASKRGGLPEIVRHNVNGLLVDPDEPDTLGVAMRKLADDRALLVRLATAAPSAVSAFRDHDEFVSEYERVCAQLASH